MRHQHLAGCRETALPRTQRRKTIVITDDGVSAALVILQAAQATQPGSRFSHHGREWEIRGSRHGSRVLVAVPAEAPRQ